VYRAVAKFSADETGEVRVGSFTYDAWSAKLGASIAGMTFNYIDTDWNLRCFPLCFFDTKDLAKYADDHERIIQASVKDNDKLSDNVLIFSGTSDTEAAVALGVDQYLNFSGSVCCICHVLALAVNDGVSDTSFIGIVLTQINSLVTYLKTHPKVNSKLMQVQCRSFSKDRIVTLDHTFSSRWHSKLNALEKYIVLRPILLKILPSDAPQVLDNGDENCIAKCIYILREIRRVARALEADRREKHVCCGS